MRKEAFFEVLGGLDNDIVKGAETTMKKKLNWKVWGAMAACLALVCVFAVNSVFLNNNDNLISQGLADVAPMVYVNDTLYKQSDAQQGYPEQKDDFIYLGKIRDTASEDSTPKENFQANDSIIGCKVYQYGEDIVVHINGAYWLYTKYDEPEVDWDNLTEQEKEQLDPTYTK